mmetsp:Transcript_52718/g.98901  ORF Transcript_52718/g.98901 Transcript_52718/m.98901 type:complete len:1286 (+) Transcript_52718:108-3965(+)
MATSERPAPSLLSVPEGVSSSRHKSVSFGRKSTARDHSPVTEEDWIAEALSQHNKLRELHASPKLQWSEECYNLAKLQAEECHTQGRLVVGNHIEGKSGRHGQNVFQADGENTKARPKIAVETWYDQGMDYDFSRPRLTLRMAQFTQLLWASTSSVGLAVSPDGKFIVANYLPAGNVGSELEKNVLRSKKERIGLVVPPEVEKTGILFAQFPPLPIVVRKVVAGSWADNAAIRPGDCIVQINGISVSTLTAETFKSLMSERPLSLKFPPDEEKWAVKRLQGLVRMFLAKAKVNQRRAQKEREARMKERGMTRENIVDALFKRFDVDTDGRLSQAEMLRYGQSLDVLESDNEWPEVYQELGAYGGWGDLGGPNRDGFQKLVDDMDQFWGCNTDQLFTLLEALEFEASLKPRAGRRGDVGRGVQELVCGVKVKKIGMVLSMPPSPLEVKKVVEKGWADERGIELGDTFVELNGIPVYTMTRQQFETLLRQRPLRLRLANEEQIRAAILVQKCARRSLAKREVKEMKQERAEQEEHDRLTTEVFQALDRDKDGFLNKLEMLYLVRRLEFSATDEDWFNIWPELAEQYALDPQRGMSQEQFRDLIQNDEGDWYCNVENLKIVLNSQRKTMAATKIQANQRGKEARKSLSQAKPKAKQQAKQRQEAETLQPESGHPESGQPEAALPESVPPDGALPEDQRSVQLLQQSAIALQQSESAVVHLLHLCRQEQAFDADNVHHLVALLGSEQLVAPPEERMHPWVESPKTVGALAATRLAILASKADKEKMLLKEEISEAGAIPPLVNFTRADDHPDRVQIAVVALRFLTAGCFKAAKAAYREGAMPLLLEHLDSPSDGMRAAAARALRNICLESEEYRNNFMFFGGMVALIQRLDPAADPILNHSLEAVMNFQDMIKDTSGYLIPKYVLYAVENGAKDRLRQLANSSDEDVGKAAADCLSIIIEVEKAATQIQKVQRAKQTRREVKKKRDERQHKERQAQAAKKMQSVQRGRQVRQEVKQINEKRHEAAVKVQSAERARQARRDVAQVRREAEQLAEDRQKAALKIQSFRRGKKAREDVQNMKDQRAQAATRIQSAHRGRQQRLKTGPVLEERRRAAIQIQSRHRGLKARQQAQLKRDRHDPQWQAASKIQARYRGNQARRSVHRLRAEKFRDQQEYMLCMAEAAGLETNPLGISPVCAELPAKLTVTGLDLDRLQANELLMAEVLKNIRKSIAQRAKVPENRIKVDVLQRRSWRERSRSPDSRSGGTRDPSPRDLQGSRSKSPAPSAHHGWR